jgi:hypothetical protein
VDRRQLLRAHPTPNAASSPCCSATSSAPRISPAGSTPKTCAPWCGAYQEAAVEVIGPYEGHIAQYLGNGLLVYFGYPQAHEDDTRRVG